jgi:hypothetical protein
MKIADMLLLFADAIRPIRNSYVLSRHLINITNLPKIQKDISYASFNRSKLVSYNLIDRQNGCHMARDVKVGNFLWQK